MLNINTYRPYQAISNKAKQNCFLRVIDVCWLNNDFDIYPTQLKTNITDSKTFKKSTYTNIFLLTKYKIIIIGSMMLPKK